MNEDYIEDKKFDKNDFAAEGIKKANYDACSFIKCNFTNTNLSGIVFTNCEFIDCNLSMTKINKTSFQEVVFKDCKLLGVHFDECSNFLLEMKFENCTADLCSFYKLSLKKINFINTSLTETDFTEADCSGAIFNNCNLYKATFYNTNLSKADLRSALNYSIDPDINQVKKAMFTMPGVLSLLDKFDIDIS